MIACRSVLDAGTVVHRCRRTTWRHDLCRRRRGKDSSLPGRGGRRLIGAHGARPGVGCGAERAAQQKLLPPSVELPAADAVLARHRSRRRARHQAFGHDLALLLGRPATAALARGYLGGLTASARMISRRTDPYVSWPIRHHLVLRHGRHLAPTAHAAQCGDATPLTLRERLRDPSRGRPDGRHLGNLVPACHNCGKHGADLNLAVLYRRRAAQRAGHECRTTILPMAAFVYAVFAMTRRPRRGLGGCSCADGAAARSSCAAVAIAAKSTAALNAPGRSGGRRNAPPRSATRRVRVAGAAMPTGHAVIALGEK
jgi:hypothetical protein